jgi:hypothetical protein
MAARLARPSPTDVDAEGAAEAGAVVGEGDAAARPPVARLANPSCDGWDERRAWTARGSATAPGPALASCPVALALALAKLPPRRAASGPPLGADPRVSEREERGPLGGVAVGRGSAGSAGAPNTRSASA